MDAPLTVCGHSWNDTSPEGSIEKAFLDQLEAKLEGIWGGLARATAKDLTTIRLEVRRLLDEATHSDRLDRRIGVERNKLLQPDWEGDWLRSRQVYSALFCPLRGLLSERDIDYLYAAFQQLVRFVADGTTDHLRQWISGDLGVALGNYPSLRGRAVLSAGQSVETKPKASTVKGEARAKLIAALTLHHKYQDGGCLNLKRIGVNGLAREADVAPSSASVFFKREYGGHKRYTVLCRDPGRLVESLKVLNGEFSPMMIGGRACRLTRVTTGGCS